MPPDEYLKAFEKALADLTNKVQQRDLLNADIAGLRETVRVLSSRIELGREQQQRLAQLMAMVEHATPGLRDSILALLSRRYPAYLTAIDVRNDLEGSGFSFDDFANSLSACHATLKRLLSDNEVEASTNEDGKTIYRRVLKLPPPRIGLIDMFAAISAASSKATAADLIAPPPKDRLTIGQRLAKPDSLPPLPDRDRKK